MISCGHLKILLKRTQRLNLDAKSTHSIILFFFRALLRRNLANINELKNVLSFNGTYREMINSLTDSQEFSNIQPLLPTGHLWMSEIDGLRFWFNTSDHEMDVPMAMGIMSGRKGKGLYSPAFLDVYDAYKE